jgi:hypothetical protein
MLKPGTSGNCYRQAKAWRKIKFVCKKKQLL